MKKALFLLLSLFLMPGSLSACGSGNGAIGEDDERIRIVTTIFPEYDWVMNVLGDNPADAEVTMLVDSGVDFHSFQPAADDILKISTCDLFIYVGGESDEWVKDALQDAANKDMVQVSLLDVLGNHAREEEIVQGMQGEENDEPDGDGGGTAGQENGGAEYDEHVWLSLNNAALFARSISEAVSSIDAEHADVYQKNAGAYAEKLSALDAGYRDTVSSSSVSTLLFGDRFPFRYLVDDYGLSYYAAFAGCSAETEASFETVTFLAKKVDELSLHAVMTIEGTDHRIAETIIQNTDTKDQKILEMDSMQSVTAEDVENGTTYLSLMEKNLEVLGEALR